MPENTKQGLVQNILSWYESDPPGVLTNLYRILNHGHLKGTGKLLILPVDQGFEHGPDQSFLKNPEAYDPHYHWRLAIEGGCNAFAAPLGFIEAGAREHVGQIPTILKINNSDLLYKTQNPIPVLTSGIDAALRLGCVAIGFTIYPGSSFRKTMYEEIARLVEDAKRAGLVIVIWSYPRGEGLKKEHETALDVISYAAHIAAQLGAHIIKVKPPTHIVKNPDIYKGISFKDSLPFNLHSLSDRTKIVLRAAFNFKRIVIFSGGVAKTENDLLNEIEQLFQGGSFGSIVGRNAFQRKKPEALSLLQKIVDIYLGSNNVQDTK